MKTHSISAINAAARAIIGASLPDLSAEASIADRIALIERAGLAAWLANRSDSHTRLLREAHAQITHVARTTTVAAPASWKPDPKWPKFYRDDGACVYEANGRWHGYLAGSGGVADTITDDRDDLEDGLQIGERELSFATAREMIDWIDRGYPFIRAAA